MTAPRSCPKCGEALPATPAGSVRCPRCDHDVVPPRMPDLDLGPGGPNVRVTSLPPPPPPLKPVLLSSETAPAPPPAADGREWIRCPNCKARLRRHDDHCFLCGQRMGPRAPEPEELEPAGPSPRRDCEPHRGALIGTLARVSVISGGLSFAGLLILPLAAVSVLAAAAGIGAVVMARDDLELMDRQVMDPTGREATLAGQGQATTGIVLGIAGALLSLLVKMPTLLS